MKIIRFFFLLIISETLWAQNYEIYVSDAGNFNLGPWQILKFDENGHNPHVFISNNLNWPQDILFPEDSNVVLISNLGNGKISSFLTQDGTYIGDFATSLTGPTRIKMGPDELLYVLLWSGNGKVRRYKLNGTFVDEFTTVGVAQSIGLDWDKKGNLYVSSYSGDFVRKYDTAGNDLGLFIDSNLQGPTNIWFDAKGDLLVADYDGGAVKRFDSSGTYQGIFIPGLANCEGIDIFPDGNILIGNGGTSSVKMYDSSGNYLTDLISSGSGNLINPNGIKIREVTSTGITDFTGDKDNLIQVVSGNEFQFDPEKILSTESIFLYNIYGSLIERVEIDNLSRWKSHHLDDGIYIMRILFKGGRIYAEKITVKK